MFQRVAPAVLILTAAVLPLLGSAARANVELVLVEPGGKAGVRRVSISRQASPGPGKELRVLIAGAPDATVSVAAFNRKGELVSVPEIAGLPSAGQTRELPERDKWQWDAADKISDIYVILAGAGAADFAAYKEQVSKMGGGSAELRKMQGNAVLRWIEAHLKSPTGAADYSMKPEPTPMGGLIRGTDGFGAPVTVPDGRSVVMRIRLQP